MKKNTKKKVLTLALVIALLAIVMIGGSLAWFTAEDEATNTFTVGSIKIEQHEDEFKRDDTGNRTEETQPFSDNKVLLPIVNVDNPYNDKNYQDKIVTIENTGRNPAYVRTFIAFPKSLEVTYLGLDIADAETEWDFEAQSEITYDGETYRVYCYIYNTELEVDGETPALLKGVYLHYNVDLKDNPATENSDNLEFCVRNSRTGEYNFSGYEIATADGNAIIVDDEGNTKTVNVLVLTQAVQAEGFDSAKEALDAAFGTVGIDYDPFAANA